MITATDIIARLQDRGYRLSIEGGRLKVRGPERPPAELEQAISEHKAEILDRLREKGDEGEASKLKPGSCIHGFKDPQKCASCNGYAAWLASDEKRLEEAVRNPDRARANYRKTLKHEPRFDSEWPEILVRYDQKVVAGMAAVEEALEEKGEFLE